MKNKFKTLSFVICLALLVLCSLQAEAFLTRNEIVKGIVYSDLEVFVLYEHGRVKGVIENRTNEPILFSAEIRFFDIRHNPVANAFVWDLHVPAKDKSSFCVFLHDGSTSAAKDAYKVEWVLKGQDKMGNSGQTIKPLSFEFGNISYQSNPMGTKFIGEITNTSERNLSVANFVLSVYTTNDKLLDVLRFSISNFRNGSIRSFSVFSNTNIPDTINLKVQFDSGF